MMALPEVTKCQEEVTHVAIAFYAEIPSMSTENAENVLKQLNLNGRSPKGQLFHAEGPLPTGGTWVFDIWETEQAMGAFFEKDLGPIMGRLGVTPPQPKLVPARVLLSPQELKRV